MCRLMAYIGEPILAADLVTRPSRSIITQSFDSRERLSAIGYLNADGFGVAWYAPEVATIDPTPCVFTSITPAWSNENLYSLSKKVITPLLFAHVRAATPGQGVNESNCHPFHCGRYVFMHNGEVGGINQIRRILMAGLSDRAFRYACEHSSDSALAFSLFLDQLHDVMAIHTPDELRRMIEVVVGRIHQAQDQAGVVEQSLLNFVVSDGFSIVATRYVRDPTNPDALPASLYLAAGAKFEPVDGKGEYRIIHTDRRNHLAIISSEPLTDDKTDWLPIMRNHVVVITEDLHVLSAPLNPKTTPDDQISDISMCLERLVVRSLHTDVAWISSMSDADHLNTRLMRQNSESVYRVPSVRQPLKVQAIDACVHTLAGHTRTVLALALHPARPLLFSASQDSTVRVWNTQTHQCTAVLRGHTAGVLSIAIAGDLLVTASSDRTVKLWDVITHECVGHARCRAAVFTVNVIDRVIYCGLQDNSVLRFDMDDILFPAECPSAAAACPRIVGTPVGQHCGFIYVLCRVGEYIASGSGDSTIKVWRIKDGECVGALVGHRGGVMALASDCSAELLSGASDFTIKVWDMASMGCKRTLKGHANDVLSIALKKDYVYSGDADGNIFVWRRDTHQQVLALKGKQDGAIQTLLMDGCGLLYSGDSDAAVRVWETKDILKKNCGTISAMQNRATRGESLEVVLREFVRIKTVSMDESCREDCWRGAKFLCSLLEDIGAAVTLVSMVEGKNPIVLARIGNDTHKPTVVVYGHYDVQPASDHGWICDPWEATSVNGYMYGRGVTDDKGPILATVYAVQELMEEGELPVNVVFAYEGEQEQSKNASCGFHEAVTGHVSMFSDADLIVVSNNYWITDTRPCLTYGMRGSINMEVRVDGPKEDLHSGVDGGVVVEPFSDLMAILADLVDSRGMVLIPGFYEDVAEVTSKEMKLYDEIEFDITQYKNALGVREICHGTSGREVLMARWRQPSLSVTGVRTSTSDSRFSIISKSATGEVNIRYVPNQSGERLVAAVKHHLAHEFNKRHSPNTMSVRILQNADWWLGDPYGPAFIAASSAIEEVWGVKPLYVREGGTMAITPFLAKTLDCPALHLPLGQASDGAHLANERISLNNLHKGKDVIKRLFTYLHSLPKQKRAGLAQSVSALDLRTHSNVSNSSR